MNDIENELSICTVSDGDSVSVSDIQCTCVDEIPLWQSNIAEYGVTDGLLLLILVVLTIQTAMLAGKRGKNG